MRLARERLKVDALFVRQHFAAQMQLDHRQSHARPRVRIDPDGAAIKRQRLRRIRRRLEAHFVRVIAVDVDFAHELVAIFVGEVNVERKLRHLLRLNERQLGNLAVLPLHAVDVEVAPHPVRTSMRIRKIVAADRRFDRFSSFQLKAKLRRNVAESIPETTCTPDDCG